MSASKKPRKQYRPKWIAQNTVQIAVMGARRLDLMDVAAFMLPLRGAITAISKGRAGRTDWTCLFDAVNTAEQLCPMLAGKDWREWVEQTQSDVLAVYDGAGDVLALHHVADTFAELIGAATCRQMLEAQASAARKINAALMSGRSNNKVRVVDPGEMRISAWTRNHCGIT